MEQETVEAAAEVAEIVVLTTYEIIGHSSAVVFAAMFISLVLYRSGRAFHQYIYTGGFDKFLKSSVFATMIDECPEDSPKAFITGTHPAGIFFDIALMGLVVAAMPFLWSGVLPIMLITLLGYVMRQRIARKQDFVAKLDGSHPDMDDHGAEGMTQSYTGGGSGNA